MMTFLTFQLSKKYLTNVFIQTKLVLAENVFFKELIIDNNNNNYFKI